MARRTRVSAGRPIGSDRGVVPGLLAVLGAGLATLVLGAPAATAASSDATTVLAERYAPIVVVREQPVPCGEGEPYRPTTVETVLGQPGVVLRGPDGQGVQEPTAADLAGLGADWYLDYPGNPLAPGCDYETWYRENSVGIQPTLYSRVATDPGHPGQLALQYWFFYTYNDWNDKHEGDWEMVQIVFPAATADEALAVAPTDVAYAQHEGSQVSTWDSDGLVRVGERIVVYPGQGSHAAYYGQHTWFGKSAAAGFGCDNTAPPGLQVQPRIDVLPGGAPPTTGPYAWVSFTGHWGQQAPSFNNGPTGPVTKDQWAAPITWMQEQGRTSAVSLPEVPGPALRGFCGLTASGSLLFIDLLDQPVLVVAILLALLLVVIWLVRRTSWRHAQSDDPDRLRHAGQIITAAFGWTRRHAGAVSGIAALMVAGSLASRAGIAMLLPAPAPGDITGTTESVGWMGAVAALLLAAVILVLVGWVAASVISLVRDDADGGQLRTGAALRAGGRARSGMAAAVLLLLVALLLTGSLVLIPVAAWLVARWAVAPAAAVVEGLGLRASLRRSAQLTSGQRWRTLGVQAVLSFVALSLAGLLGALLLLLTGWPFWVTGLIGTVLVAVLLPVAFVGTTLQYFDLRRRAGGAGAVAAPEPSTAG